MGPGSGSWALPSAWEKEAAAGTQSTKGPAISPAVAASPPSQCPPRLQPSTGNAGVVRKGRLSWALRDQRKRKVQGREPQGHPMTLENHSLTQRWTPPDLQLAVPTERPQSTGSEGLFHHTALLKQGRIQFLILTQQSQICDC